MIRTQSTTEMHTMDGISSVDLSPDVEEIKPLISDKVKKVSKSIFFDLLKGLAKSRILKSLIASAIAVGILFAITSNPVGWLIALVAISSILLALTAQLLYKGWPKITFEISTIVRLLKKKNYNKIYTLEETQASIFLGALPNRLSSDGEKLVNDEHVGAVLSVNEDWEKTPMGLSVPYTAQNWAELGIEEQNYKQIHVLDHHPLDENQFNEVADWIRDRLADGINVYVHCRGGNGRSAMAIASYLIKHQKRPEETKPIQAVKRAETVIKKGRPISTIGKKRCYLERHARSCSNLFSQ